MDIFPADTIETNYNSGPYEILEVFRCTCDFLEGDGLPGPLHMHFHCRHLKCGRKGYWLNNYAWTEDDKLISPPGGRENGTYDEIFIVGHVKNQQLDLLPEMEAG